MTGELVEPTPARGSRSGAYQRRMANRSALLFAITLFGYPIVGSLISLLQVDSRFLSIPFRIAVGLFSIWVILTARRVKLDVSRQLMLFIWFLYILRLLYDWLVPHLQGADYALQFFFVSCALPAFALMKAQVYDRRRFALMSFLIASTGALMGLLVALFGNTDVPDSGLVPGRLSLVALNPVTLGNEAAGAILCGLALWRDARLLYRLMLLCTFMVLLWCIVKTGSKGPLLQLLVCAGIWALRRGYLLRLGVLALPLIVWLVFSTENPLAARLTDSSDDPSTLDRVVMLNDSMDQIAGSPLIGSAFVELNSGYYPHDVFIESALAFGVPMALVFTGLVLVATYRAWKTLRSDYDLLGLLFIQGLLDATVAGALYGAAALWVMLAILPPAGSAVYKRVRHLPDAGLPAPSAR